MRRRKQTGYSLVEVLVAVAVTGFVLLTVVTLFYMGRRNVYSGKQTTYAASVATRMLEDLSGMAGNDVLTNFAITDATALTDPTVNGVQYTGAWMIDTTSAGGANDPQSYLTNWKALIGSSALANARAGLIITPRNPVLASAKWTSAQYLKIRVFVTWDESQHTRYAFFDTTKVCRGGCV